MALTAYTLLGYDQDNSQRYNTVLMKGNSATTYRGAAVGAQGSTGYGRTLVAGDVFLGFSEETVVATSTDGAVTCGVRSEGAVELAVPSAAVTDLNRDVFASDENTFTYTAGGNSLVGKVIRWVSTGKVIVAFNAATGVN